LGGFDQKLSAIFAKIPPQKIKTCIYMCNVCFFLRQRQRYGLTVFLTNYTTGLGSAYSPVALMTTCSHYKQEQPATYPFGQCLTAALAHQN
ncbi:hypothetical protein, partial [Xenorhabdus entomophaga]|uniref:hypothetical protein n=1 Tax=Xenorhabdus entomophaga TaxID=3136257 RepID=UPI0030F47B91